MKLLLDTQCWLWLQTRPERLGASWIERLRDLETMSYLSAASAWEIAIKFALGRMRLPVPPVDYVPDRMTQAGTKALPVTHAHALGVAELPAHHKDPFDRLLVAQARAERIPLLTADRQLEPYPVELRWVD